jgi:uncharacterized phage protein (TIGR01671 family)
MREHIGLFRGKRVDNGEWVEGNLVHITLSPIQDWWEITTGRYDAMGHMVSHKIDPDTVGECTGLKDKNGKLIFEGDLLKPFDDEIDKIVVEFYSGVFMLSLYGDRGYMTEYGWECEGNSGVFECEPLESYGADVEIIGNIHDNPELMGGAGENADN